MKALYATALMAALLLISVPAPVFSQMMDMPMKEHCEGHGQMMDMDNMGAMMGMCMEHADEMGLTDDQIMKMKTIHREMQKKQARFKADLKIVQIDLMEVMEMKNFDLEKAGAAIKNIAEIKTAHQMEMLKDMKGMRALLTDEQFEKMKKMMPMKMVGKKPAKGMMKKQ